MKNFVIMYREREGSSPIVATMGNHKHIHLPLFEQLDHYVAKDFADNDTIADVVDNILHGRAIEHGGQVMARKLDDRALAETSIGFKWRFWGNPDRIRQTLARDNAVVFHLFRRNLIELAASLYFTSTIIPRYEAEHGVDLGGGGHLQFSLTKLTQDEREAKLALLHSVQFDIPTAAVRDTAEKILKEKTDKYRRYIDGMNALNIPTYSILYEDFCTDKPAFFTDLYNAIGVDPAQQSELGSHFTKVGGENFLDQVRNLAEVEADPGVHDVLRRYDDLIFDRHIYLGRSVVRRVR